MYATANKLLSLFFLIFETFYIQYMNTQYFFGFCLKGKLKYLSGLTVAVYQGLS